MISLKELQYVDVWARKSPYPGKKYAKETLENMKELEKFNFGKLETKDTSKLLYSPSNEAICPYFLIRLVKDDDKETYCVSSLLAPQETELKQYFEFKATIPTQMIIDDNENLNKIVATPKEKIGLLNQYKSIIMSYGLENKLDISGDYLATLAELDNNQKKKIK